MTATPTKIERLSDDEIQIGWDDGQVRRYRVAEIRQRCPCATCREKRTAAAAEQDTNMLPVISHAETLPTRIEGMRPVGNYAYNIRFNDGHDTGIFTFEFLRELGEAVTSP